MHDQEYLGVAERANGADSGANCGVIFTEHRCVWDILYAAVT
jgi:hypothetical protein